MTLNELLLLLLSFGILTVSIILLFLVIIKEFREKSDEYFIFIILLGIGINILIPVILGIIQEIL